MIQYVVVNGFPGSGKTTFESYCLDKLGYSGCAVSSIDIIKQVARELGWNGEKTPETRRFLSMLKDLSTYYFDSSWNSVQELAENTYEASKDYTNKLFVFVDVREPQEIERYAKERNAITVFVNRNSVSKEAQSNTSDMDVSMYNYDYTIENNGNLKDLKNKANSFIIELLKKGNKK